MNKLLELSKIFERFIDKKKGLNETGKGMFLDPKKPERDIDIKYIGVDYVLTIREMAK